MKKYLSFAVTAMAILGLGSLTSCHDEDFGASTAVLQERAFEQGFIKEFGQPSADQSWDFYAQKMEALGQGAGMTRATQAIAKARSINQPIGEEYFDEVVANVKSVLEDNLNNSAHGQNSYSLTSTGNFNIYAVLYQGWYTQAKNRRLEFGMVYNGTEIPLFGPINYSDYYKVNAAGNGRTPCSQGDPINPGRTVVMQDNKPVNQAVSGFGWEISSTAGDKFSFYMKLIALDSDNKNRMFEYYSNSSTYDYSNTLTYYNYNGGTFSTPSGVEGHDELEDRYQNNPAGPSVLVYSKEVKDGDTYKRIMIIGFEDAWADKNADADYNDVVIVLEGNLPEPTSKRFFCEDKESFDWDYNDVVFDVSNYGITLRAVGGTLPVFLRVTDKNGDKNIVGVRNEDSDPNHLGDKKMYYELHELMRSQQYQSDYKEDGANGAWHRAIHKNDQLTYTLNGKTYYRPIDVGIKPQGMWLDPVLIVDWLNHPTLELSDEDVKDFANPVPNHNKVGDVELIVLPQSQYSSNGYRDRVEELTNLTAFSSPGNDPDEPKIIKLAGVGTVPAIWSAPVSVSWMKELKKITLGYKDFFGNGDSDAVYGRQWWEKNKDISYMYDFTGDGAPTYNP